jgi:hypothetical protein
MLYISRNSETCQDDSIVVLFMNIVFISCTKTILIYAIAHMTIIDFVVLGCIPWHSAAFQGSLHHSKAVGYIPRQSAAFECIQLYSNALGNILRDSTLTQILSMEDPYESTNQQGRLRARIAEYTKPPSDTKVIGNTICIVLCILIIKTTTFMYEIKHLDPLTEILLLTTSSNTIFPIHCTENEANYSALCTTCCNGFRF